jgi:hypothetical protein
VKGKGPICIGNVKMTPISSRREPWIFSRITDARDFSILSCRAIWASIPGDPRLHHIWPGGRHEVYPPEVRVKWEARWVEEKRPA